MFSFLLSSLADLGNTAHPPCTAHLSRTCPASTIGAAYFKVGEVRDGVDSDLAGWGRGGLSYRGRPGRTI